MTYLKTLLVAVMLITAGISSPKAGVEVGDTAPDFSLKSVDGKMVSLGANKNVKGYILVFTCNTCPYSVMYEDRIIALHNKYAEQGYPVLAIQPNNPEKSPGDSFAKMKERANDKSFPFPYAIDNESQETTAAYGATNTPHVYVLQKQSNSSFKVAYIGAIDNNSRNPQAATKRYVESAVDALLAGSGIETTSTKAIGCTIKWAD